MTTLKPYEAGHTRELTAVGKPVVRVDGREKVSGAARYVDDLEFGPDLMHAELVESPHAHALIKRIDTSAAEALPGVVRVVTGKDFPFEFGLYMKDRYVFAQDRVRFVGEQVAAVIARTLGWRSGPPGWSRSTTRCWTRPSTRSEAMGEDAPLIHPGLGGYPTSPGSSRRRQQRRPLAQDCARATSRPGSPRPTSCSRTPIGAPLRPRAIEPHVPWSVTHDRSGRLTLWSASQSPYTQRNLFAEALDLPHQQIRVVTPYVGGGFGGKAGVTMEIMGAALATTVTGHPVKVHWSREQEFTNTYQRQGLARPPQGRGPPGRDDHGPRAHLHWDAGAYVEYGANVVNAAGLSATGPYRIDNVHLDSLCIYTNLPPGGPYRGFGYSEFTFGIESHIDRLAPDRDGPGRVPPSQRHRRRRRAALRRGDEPLRAARGDRPGRRRDRVGQSGGTRPGANVRVGKGFAAFWKAPAMPPNAGSASFLKFNEDGSSTSPSPGWRSARAT
jgi:CO/xanthine dehydrogenase Mo-binding subunit